MKNFLNIRNSKSLCILMVIIFIVAMLSILYSINLNASTIENGNFTFEYGVQNDWSSGASVSVAITNNGSTNINGWTLSWVFPNNQKITNMWDATYVQNGNNVTVTNQSYNEIIPANKGKVNFGFNISYSGTNTNPIEMTLNGNTSNVTISPNPTNTSVVTSQPTVTSLITATPTVTGSVIPTVTGNITPTNIKIMPLGDSITDGITVPGAYRIKLWNNIKKNGYNVDFVGSLSNGPAELGDKDHEGHSGWRIDQLDAKINTWMDNSKPKIVLLHIGTNDISQSYDLANAPNRMSGLIDKICAKLPSGGKLYVATIIPISYASVSNYNLQVSNVVKNKANTGKPVYLVDMYSALTTADLADGVHPNLNGYNKMADVWFNAIRNDLK